MVKTLQMLQAQNAHDKGMIGMILYSDPADSGSKRGKVRFLVVKVFSS